jgi:RES domain-containing protein
LAGLPLIHVNGRFWRVVKNQYMQGPPPGAPPGAGPQPLWPGGAARAGARFTPVGGADSLYLASSSVTALAEVDAVLFDPAAGLVGGPHHDPLLVVETRVRLPAVLDLCDGKIRAALGTSGAELTAPWVRAQARHKAGRGPLPTTQQLGEAAFAASVILGLRYPSRKHPGARNLVAFTDRLAALKGSVVLRDTSGTLKQSLP